MEAWLDRRAFKLLMLNDLSRPDGGRLKQPLSDLGAKNSELEKNWIDSKDLHPNVTPVEWAICKMLTLILYKDVRTGEIQC